MRLACMHVLLQQRGRDPEGTDGTGKRTALTTTSQPIPQPAMALTASVPTKVNGFQQMLQELVRQLQPSSFILDPSLSQ